MCAESTNGNDKGYVVGVDFFPRQQIIDDED
jgi:hypothetical protein